MVVPADVVNAARDGDFDVVAAYFASEPREVEDDCESAPGRTMPVPLLSAALSPPLQSFMPVEQRVPVEDDKIRIVELLLTHGTDPNRRNGWGYVPLACAVCNCFDGTPRMVQVLFDAGADARVMGFERSGRLVGFVSLVGLLLTIPIKALPPPGVTRPLKNHLTILKMLLRAGASIDNCKAVGLRVLHAESQMDDAEKHLLFGSRIARDADWIAMRNIVAGVRREGSWKAYCRVEHKRLIRFRSYLVRGYAETTDPLIESVLRLANGACWKVLAYWREAA